MISIRFGLFKSSFIPFLTLLSLGLQATFYQCDIWRKTVTLPNGQIGYRYRIGLYDLHVDYADQRIGKKQQSELIEVIRYLQQHHKSVQLVVEDITDYEGDNPILSQTIQEINLQCHPEVDEASPMSEASGSSMSGLTDFCKKNNIPCCNVEFRHATAVTGMNYQPNYDDVMRDITASVKKLENNHTFRKLFSGWYEFIQNTFKKLKEECSPTNWEGEAFRFQCLLLEGHLLTKLMDYENDNISYVIMAFGGDHLRFVDDAQAWKKLGYTKLTSLSVSPHDDSDKAILLAASTFNLAKFLQQYLPDLAGMTTTENRPRPTVSTTSAPGTLVAQILRTMHALTMLSNGEIDRSMKNMGLIERMTVWAIIDAALFTAFVINKINPKESLLTSAQYKTIITPLQAIAEATQTPSHEIDFHALQQLAANPAMMVALETLSQQKLIELQKALQKLLTAAQTPTLSTPASYASITTQRKTKAAARRAVKKRTTKKPRTKARPTRKKGVSKKKSAKSKKIRKANKKPRKKSKQRSKGGKKPRA